mgnify:CR=1 FL=1|jgi:hypothetical protein
MCKIDENLVLKYSEYVIDPPIFFGNVPLNKEQKEAMDFNITKENHSLITCYVVYDEPYKVDFFEKKLCYKTDVTVIFKERTIQDSIELHNIEKNPLMFQYFGTGSMPLSCYASTENNSEECFKWFREKMLNRDLP